MAVARTSTRSVIAATRSAVRNAESRVPSPRNGGFGTWACIPASRWTASAGLAGSGASGSWRARVARFRARVESGSIPGGLLRGVAAGPGEDVVDRLELLGDGDVRPVVVEEGADVHPAPDGALVRDLDVEPVGGR